MRDVHQVRRELRKTVTTIEQGRSGCRLDDHVPDALLLVIKHRARFVGDAPNMISQFVRGIGDRIQPIPFAHICRIDSPVPNDRAKPRPGRKHPAEGKETEDQDFERKAHK